MAETMTRTEVDEMMKQFQEGETQERAPFKKSPEGKRFSHHENKNRRFQFEYHSPVIKAYRVTLNPDPNTVERRVDPLIFSSHRQRKIIARTPDNYIQYKRHLETRVR